MEEANHRPMFYGTKIPQDDSPPEEKRKLLSDEMNRTIKSALHTAE